jgi:hypothetical protein
MVKQFHNVEQFAKKVHEKLNYSSANLSPEYRYVAWLDMMGAGFLMNTSLQKSANALARLHTAVELARQLTSYSDDLLPMNDGLFMISSSKLAVMKLVQQTMIFLSARFINTLVHQERFLIRGAIAYGPVVTGTHLAKGFARKKLRQNSAFVKNVFFGPPIVQAFEAERNAPPYGIAIHESARAFAESGQRPFQGNLWLWWHKNDDGSLPPHAPPLTDLKMLMKTKLDEYFDWMVNTRVFHTLSEVKIGELRAAAEQYLSAK